MSGFVVLPSGCWNWLGRKKDGYGRITVNKQRHQAYRWVYGEIPEGKEMHHVCKNRACVNPEHLMSVTKSEHSSLEPRVKKNSKSHCRNGHPFDDVNTYISNGHRFCRACNRAAVMKYQTRKEQEL